MTMHMLTMVDEIVRLQETWVGGDYCVVTMIAVLQGFYAGEFPLTSGGPDACKAQAIPCC